MNNLPAFNSPIDDAGDLDAGRLYRFEHRENPSNTFYGQFMGGDPNYQGNDEVPMMFLVNNNPADIRSIILSEYQIEPCNYPRCEYPAMAAPAAGGKRNKRKSRNSRKSRKSRKSRNYRKSFKSKKY